jgi:hypothetical protein
VAGRAHTGAAEAVVERGDDSKPATISERDAPCCPRFLAQANITASKPDPVLVAMVAAVCRASSAYAARRAAFIGALERGQYPPPSLLSVDDSLELLYCDVKYAFRVTRAGPAALSLACNDSRCSAEFRALPDGGLLVVLVGLGRSHVAYATDGPGGLRLVLDGVTCLFQVRRGAPLSARSWHRTLHCLHLSPFSYRAERERPDNPPRCDVGEARAVPR